MRSEASPDAGIFCQKRSHLGCSLRDFSLVSQHTYTVTAKSIHIQIRLGCVYKEDTRSFRTADRQEDTDFDFFYPRLPVNPRLLCRQQSCETTHMFPKPTLPGADRCRCRQPRATTRHGDNRLRMHCSRFYPERRAGTYSRSRSLAPGQSRPAAGKVAAFGRIWCVHVLPRSVEA
jgi:hypothetical protein